jgi:glycosyltransferase involved in cell wall biosynthesis
MEKKRKKLCIVLPFHWSYLMGGSEYQIKCLLTSDLIKKKFEIYIISRWLDSIYKPDGYKLIQVVKPYALQRYTYIFDAPFLWNKLRAIAPDVIYQNIGTSYAYIAASYACSARCKMVLHIASDSDVMSFKNKKKINTLIPYIEKKAFDYAIRNADKLIAQTHFQKNQIARYYNRVVDAVIPNFQPSPVEPISKGTPLKVVWIANFKPLKQPEIFIRLAGELTNTFNDLKFIMIGNPATNSFWQSYLEQQIQKVPNLTYLGRQTIEEVNKILAKSHILVNTSRYEGFSNTFIQAWMRCVPVVSLNSNPDGLLTDKNFGFVSSGSYEQLRSDVIHLIRDKELMFGIGKKAQAFALKKFSLKNTEDVLRLL